MKHDYNCKESKVQSLNYIPICVKIYNYNDTYSIFNIIKNYLLSIYSMNYYQ